MSARAAVAISFIRAPPAPSRMARWFSRIHVNRGVDPAQRALLLETIDRHRRRVRHFLAQQPEDLLPDELGGEKALVAIGDLVRGHRSRRPPAAAREPPPAETSSARPFSALTGTMAANGKSAASSAICGSIASRALTRSILLRATMARRALRAEGGSPRGRHRWCGRLRSRSRRHRRRRDTA